MTTLPPGIAPGPRPQDRMEGLGFTPGPWICDGATFEYEGARFGEAAYVVSKEREQFPASAANARLIAAAPDLYEALNELRAFLGNTTGPPLLHRLAADADKAITKARGGAA